MSNQVYKRIVESASSAIELIKRSLIFKVLDHRIHSLYRLCPHEETISDAEEVISIAPDLAAGYKHLGRLYSIQGQQREAVITYETALQNVTLSNNNNYIFQQQQYHQELAKRREMAMESNDKRINFMSILSAELSDHIFAELDRNLRQFACHSQKHGVRQYWDVQWHGLL
ncbi:hypothetical protein BDA99DRAFT_508637 [Phascolomyces articulosus]|uniref:Tetratricopeptide repeat protein n=1 Tax=Phascolomyces articulosus TaxID=60185 RepID=A0AAD5KB94_9FUNG|nr:hypothetical protein BDA99DRAFT_508637 [Phascolomyces articulosus]